MENKTLYKNVPDVTNFLFDIGVESGFDIPQYFMVIFENNNVNDQTNDSSIFNEMDVTKCFRKTGSVTYPEDRLNFNYGTNYYNVSFKEIVNFNGKYNGLLDSIKPYIKHRTFNSNYRKYKFYTRYQRDHIGAQATRLNFKFARGIAVYIICHALLLTRRIISVNSDGSKMADIVSKRLISETDSQIARVLFFRRD